MIVFILFLVHGYEENILKKPWELIPIITGLAKSTTYEPSYIDDTVDEPQSTVDMFIYQPNNSVHWASDIRGTSFNLKLNPIPNSQSAVAKMSYFDEDAYPDLLIITQDLKSLRFFRNKVRENQEIVKKEQFNPDFADTAAKLEDWPRFSIYNASKNAAIVDFLAYDLNHDGVSDIVAALKHNDGSFSVLEFIFTNTQTLEYKLTEIVFENRGISKLLGVTKTEKQKNSILFLSKTGFLSSMVNKDPLYINENLVNLDQSEKLDFFFQTDLEKNDRPSFITGHSGVALWVHLEKETWTRKMILDDGVLKVSSWNSDIFVLYKNKVLWGFPVLVKGKTEDFFWEVSQETFVFHYKEIALSQQLTWNDLQISDLKKTGSVDLLLFSEELGTIFWGRKKPSNIEGLGWGPEFWIYVMVYVMFLSLGAGIFHSHYSEKIEEKNSDFKYHPQEFSVNQNKNKPNLRKTTV